MDISQVEDSLKVIIDSLYRINLQGWKKLYLPLEYYFNFSSMYGIERWEVPHNCLLKSVGIFLIRVAYNLIRLDIYELSFSFAVLSVKFDFFMIYLFQTNSTIVLFWKVHISGIWGFSLANLKGGFMHVVELHYRLLYMRCSIP